MIGRMAISAMLACLASGGAAGSERTVLLHPAEGDPIAVARLVAGPGGGFALEWDESRFSGHFLSMRPFRCLEGPDKLWCRAPYPYDNPRRIADGVLTDLEYDLIFVWKPAGAYGIDMWNGVYYVLEEKNGRIEGRLHEIDLDLLASPPESPGERLIGAADLEPGEPEDHWLPRLTIQ